jgi:hypothetical protein
MLQSSAAVQNDRDDLGYYEYGKQKEDHPPDRSSSGCGHLAGEASWWQGSDHPADSPTFPHQYSTP